MENLRFMEVVEVAINFFVQARMQKTVYSHLNLFSYDGAGKFFVAECWIPLKHIESVREALERGAVS